MEIDSKQTIKERMLKYIGNVLRKQGITNPNIGAGSEIYNIVDSFSLTFALQQAKIKNQLETINPSQLSGTDLDAFLADYGLTRKGATVSIGSIQISSVATIYVNDSYVLVDSSGRYYKPVSSGWFSSGELVTVQSTGFGSAFTINAGQYLNWQTIPSSANQQCLVVNPGISGGADAETDADFYNRYKKLVKAANAGSSADIFNYCLSISPNVLEAYVYPVIDGAATTHIVALAPQNLSITKSRTISNNIISNLQQKINADFPAGVNILLQSVADSAVDVGFFIKSNKWVDSVPFPSINPLLLTTPFVASNMTSDRKTMTINADYNILQYAQYAIAQPSLPFSGSLTLSTPLSIQWVSQIGTAVTAQIVSVSYVAVSGSQFVTTFTLSQALATTYNGTPYGASNGSYIFPAVSDIQQLLSALYSSFAKLTPGEKRGVAQIRNSRFPQVSKGYPNTISTDFIDSLNSVDSVSNANYIVDSNGKVAFDILRNTRISSADPPIATDMAYTITSPSLVFTPRRLAFYPINGVSI